MKNICRFIALFCFVLVLSRFEARGQESAELAQPPNGDNQKAEVSQWIGPVKISITYHSPRVHFQGKERTGHIWGELIPFGFFDEGFGPSKATPWRAGANETTTISFSHDVKVEGKDVPAGTYGLFLLLDKSGPWTWILSHNSYGWGSFQYDQKDDVIRVPVQPQEAPFTEFMTFGFDERLPGSAVAFLQWEKKRIPMKIEVPNVNEVYVGLIRKQLQSWAGFNYRNWQQAAQFCADNKVNLDEALVWADKAIKEPFRNAVQGREDFSTLQTKAAVLTAMGRNSEADATMDKALHKPVTDVGAVHLYGMSLLRAGKKEKAMDVFKLNAQQHPDEKFVIYVGLARGYTATGDKENAIKNWEAALQNVPENQKPNLPVYEKALKDLKEH
jgi:tetratricopeptide (TPR) repeat protein